MPIQTGQLEYIRNLRRFVKNWKDEGVSKQARRRMFTEHNVHACGRDGCEDRVRSYSDCWSPFPRGCDIGCNRCIAHCECVRCIYGHAVGGNPVMCRRDQCSNHGASELGACPECCRHRTCVTCSAVFPRDEGCQNRTCYKCRYCCKCRKPISFVNNPLKFFAAKRNERKLNSSTRFVSAEIEVAETAKGDKGLGAVIEKWSASIVSDGSVPSGFEINTSPASGDHFVTQIAEICDALKESEASVDDTCGLHVHVNARDMDYYAIRRLVKLYAKLEPVLFQMVPSGRRESRFCVPCGGLYTAHVGKLSTYKETKKTTARMLYGRHKATPTWQTNERTAHRSCAERERGEASPVTRKYHNSRYYALNLHSWFYRGTVECRLFVGTTNAAKILSWGMLWARIVDKAHDLTEAEMDTFLAWDTAYDTLCRLVSDAPAIREFIDSRLREYGNAEIRAQVAGTDDGSDTRAAEVKKAQKEVKKHESTVEGAKRQADLAERSEADRAKRKARERRQARREAGGAAALPVAARRWQYADEVPTNARIGSWTLSEYTYRYGGQHCNCASCQQNSLNDWQQSGPATMLVSPVRR